MNPLQLLPAKVRFVAYAIYGVLALAATAATAWFVAVAQAHGEDVVLPDWLIGGGAMLVPIGAAFAAVATTNVYRNPEVNTAVVQAPANVDLTVSDSVDSEEAAALVKDRGGQTERQGYGDGV